MTFAHVCLTFYVAVFYFAVVFLIILFLLLLFLLLLRLLLSMLLLVSPNELTLREKTSYVLICFQRSVQSFVSNIKRI